MPHRIDHWCPAGLHALGTDGFGRSEARSELRRFFEVSAEHIAYAALTKLCRRGKFSKKRLSEALTELALDPDGPDPATA